MDDRILFVSHSADWIGPTHSLLLLLKSLRHDFDVAVLLPRRGRFSEELERLEVPVFTMPSLTKWTLPSVTRLVGRGRFDLVYANNTGSVSRIAFTAAALNRVPFICHVREMRWNATWRQLWYFRLADAVIAVSRACADSVSRFVRRGRLHVVYNGVDLGEFVPGQDTVGLRTELGIPADALLLMSIAHVCERKGQVHAVTALAEIVQAYPSAHLCLVGSLTRQPTYVDRVRQLAEESGISDHVHLPGFRSDVPRLLQETDIFVHTSTRDPHPRAAIEAMAAGLPVVSFAADGIAETVVEGETGRLVPLEDTESLVEAVLELANCPDARTRMGAAGRKRVESHFSCEETAARVRDIVTEVILGGSARS